MVLGVVLVGICVVDMSGSVSAVGRPVRPAHVPSTNGWVRIRQVATGDVPRSSVAGLLPAGCRTDAMPFVVGVKAVNGTARSYRRQS
jgi:hypothetical protein